MAVLVVSLPSAHAQTLSLTYDANGNLVGGDGFYRVYDDFNQLSKVYNGSSDNDPLLQEYTYHPSAERVLVKKTYHANGSVKEEVRYLSKEFVHVINSSGTFNTTYVYLPGDPDDSYIAEIRPDGSTLFVHGDLLGSTSVVTNDSGAVVERTSYTPYGAALSGGRATRYTYEAKEHDPIVGDTDFHFRKYNPEWRVFTQPDSLLPNMYDPQELNRYAFERSNPVRYTDPDGHYAQALAIAYGAWKVWGLALTIAPLIQKGAEGTLTVTDVYYTVRDEAVLSLVPGTGDVLTAKKTYELFVRENQRDADGEVEEDPLKEVKEGLFDNSLVWQMSDSIEQNYNSEAKTKGLPVIGTDEQGNKIFGKPGDDLPDKWQEIRERHLSKDRRNRDRNPDDDD